MKRKRIINVGFVLLLAGFAAIGACRGINPGDFSTERLPSIQTNRQGSSGSMFSDASPQGSGANTIESRSEQWTSTSDDGGQSGASAINGIGQPETDESHQQTGDHLTTTDREQQTSPQTTQLESSPEKLRPTEPHIMATILTKPVCSQTSIPITIMTTSTIRPSTAASMKTTESTVSMTASSTLSTTRPSLPPTTHSVTTSRLPIAYDVIHMQAEILRRATAIGAIVSSGATSGDAWVDFDKDLCMSQQEIIDVSVQMFVEAHKKGLTFSGVRVIDLGTAIRVTRD